MKTVLYILSVFSFLVLNYSETQAQGSPSKNCSVLVWATVNESPAPSIILKWDQSTIGKQVFVYRKLKSESSFPANPIASLDSGVTTWTDPNVALGVSYEYKIIRDTWTKADGRDVHTWAYGYLNSGIKVPPSPRNRVLVLVDETMREPLRNELETWETDLINEGWSVTIRDVDRAEQFDSGAVGRTRRLIREEITQGKRDIDAIFLVGRVAVPYSGGFDGVNAYPPDVHGDHIGAWPADGIYGDDNGVYSDVVVSIPNSTRKSNENLIGDGKFDQSFFASAVETAVGRLDFYNMPEFTKSEVTLLKDYFKKNHSFRTNEFNVVMNGVVDENFGIEEGFASAHWRKSAAFATDTSIKQGDWFGSLTGPTTALFAHGSGGGTNTSAGGVGTTADMAANPVYAIHTELFGSYFGDWDTQNNFLRASLCTSPRTLTCAWSGRPVWYFHHMALGETIGYSTRLTQNNAQVVGQSFGTYISFYRLSGQAAIYYPWDRGVHIALMGDPTLRAIMKPIPAVSQLTASTEFPNKIKLSWIKPVGDADAYIVYRRKPTAAAWTLVTPQPITETSLQDSLKNEGALEYRVHVCALRSTASGTYYDMGKATTTTVMTTGVERDESQFSVFSSQLTVAPNPTSETATITLQLRHPATVDIRVLDIAGTVVFEQHFENLAAGIQHVAFNATELPSGRYTIVAQTPAETLSASAIVAR